MKKTLLTLLIGGTVMAGTLTAITFTGGDDLLQTETIAETFIAKAQSYMDAVEELEELASKQNVDINTLINKINELKQIKGDLLAEVESLKQELQDLEGNNSTLTAEIERLTLELEKANAELVKANTLVAEHKEKMNSLLDDSIFGEVKIPEYIDISGAVADDEATEGTE